MDPKPPAKRCQSCGMPLRDGGYGTQADGTLSEDYCSLCFADGAFTDPALTMEGMIKKAIASMMREPQMSEEQAEVRANATIPGLKRWNTHGK